MGPWFKQTALPAKLESWMDRHLGAKVGSIRVGCALMSGESKWCPQNDQGETNLHGLLYFKLDFKQRGRARLMSAQVEIALKDTRDENIVAVISCAPSNALVPQDAPTQQVSDSAATQVSPRVDVNGVGVEGLSHTKESKVESSVKQDWAFHSSKLDVNKSEFSWRRKSPEDESGLDRSYEGALVLRREQYAAVLLEAFVRIQAHKYIGSRHGERQCHCIGLDSGEQISKAAFDKLTSRHDLHRDILTRNHGSAPNCKI
jgi:hypothetical protein